ncbi:hypothetical protein BGX23_001906 [Mortierella sp. AD031]|nr:hypothetical protein BGX23_001906 [Mortierella sp. AD031]
MGLFSIRRKSKASIAPPPAVATPTNALTGQQQPKPPLALELPEMLHRTFDFIDDYTLNHTVILVCHQWFWMNQHRIIRKVNYIEGSKTKRFDKIITRLPRATHMVWHFVTEAGPLDEWAGSSKLIQALSDNNTRQIREQEQGLHGIHGQDAYFQPTTATHHGIIKRKNPLQISRILRDLDLTCAGVLFLKVLPFMGSLTGLRFQLPGYDSIPIDAVLSACPNLLSLRLESTAVFRLSDTWTPIVMPRSSSTLPLRSLIIESAFISQTSFEQVLAVTPRLKNLQLRNVRPETNAPSPQPALLHWRWLLEKLRAFAISLTSVHFSVFGQSMEEVEVYEKILMVGVQSREWVLRSFDLTPVLTHCLAQLPNVVTILELVAPGRPDSNHGLDLHDYLCASPHLVHLKAPHSVCLVERMDIHSRWTGTVSVDTSPPGIWACRNLRTLHIRVQDVGMDSVAERIGRSRILFGYISRVLPRLQDLMLLDHDDRRARIRLDLQGGFCLLARLSQLEYLRIGQVDRKMEFKAADLRWIVPSGHINGGRVERAHIFRTWDGLLADEAAMEAARAKSPWRRVTEELYKDIKLMKSLENLGLLLDVKMMVDEMEARTERFTGGMTRLRDLAIYRTLLSRPARPEKEYRRLANDNFELKRETYRDTVGFVFPS